MYCILNAFSTFSVEVHSLVQGPGACMHVGQQPDDDGQNKSVK